MSAQKSSHTSLGTGILALTVALASGACTSTPIHLGAGHPQGAAQAETIQSRAPAPTFVADTFTLTLRVETTDGDVRLVRSPWIENGAIRGYEERVNGRREVWRPAVEIDLEDVADTRAIETRIVYRSVPAEPATGGKVAGGGFLGFLDSLLLVLSIVAPAAWGC